MHPEADALLDAIWDNPRDDTPRLVYADWLQEHGHEDYAQFIRVCVFLARDLLPPDERTRLRKQRYLLGQEIVKAYPHASQVIEGRNPPDGIPIGSAATEAVGLVNGWQVFWPFAVQPRYLTVFNLCGHETALKECEHLARVVSLTCEGVVVNGGGHEREAAEWQPVAGVLLSELASNTHTDKLVALKVEPILVTPAELLAFADTDLARRLQELLLWVQFPDGTREDLRGNEGYVGEHIHDFVAQHAARFAAQPA